MSGVDQAQLEVWKKKAEELDKRKAKEKRYSVKQKIMLQKAVKAGIKVSEAEIDAELKRMG